MNLAAAALLLLCATASAQNAPGSDPLESPQCRAARAELEELIGEPQWRRSERLERARREAADVCLGHASARPPRSGAPEPAQAVPPPTLSVPRPAPLPAIAAPRGPVPIPRPTAITTCDAAGCWDSEGRRLNQIGPLLIGPGGVCNAQGGLVTCP